ncbi:hypothetical protein MJ579_19250 [Klebsiella pneumoniae]|nr:hypothetical protein MJ579_19250 [Klebsiella pneumoniae]
MGDINDIDILRQVAAAIEVSGPSSSLNTGRIWSDLPGRHGINLFIEQMKSHNQQGQ